MRLFGLSRLGLSVAGWNQSVLHLRAGGDSIIWRVAKPLHSGRFQFSRHTNMYELQQEGLPLMVFEQPLNL